GLEAELRARGVKNFRCDFFVEARYPTQVWELEVPLGKGRFDGPGDVAALAQGFHRVHERVFAVKEEGSPVECLYWRGRLTGLLEQARPARPRTNIQPQPARPHAHRAVYFADLGRVSVPIYFGTTLAPGMRVDGPAIIEEPTTTIVIYPESVSRVTPLNNYLISIN